MHQLINRHRLLTHLLSEILTGYFPLPDKAPLFIKAFIEQNQDFLRTDKVINEWLSLLETGVTFMQAEESTTDNGTTTQD